eukprot:TRINITY_DN25384_c0_g1_i1.p1 TRINITY_DN25384_c0_g1~~TRINITY_DN25384_c0_g1_i1.p1  ORF type:complete len:949 (+),score=124.42 TRINITY_DN25384_c0_g1_i1:131-2977(+)
MWRASRVRSHYVCHRRDDGGSCGLVLGRCLLVARGSHPSCKFPVGPTSPEGRCRSWTFVCGTGSISATKRAPDLPILKVPVAPLRSSHHSGFGPCNFGLRRGAATLAEVLDAAKEGEDEVASLKAELHDPSTDISKLGQQGVLWFANIYPTKAFRFDIRQAFTHHNHTTLVPELLPDGVEVLRMVPREREGGAFVYFRAPPSFVLQVLQNLAKQDGLPSGKQPRFWAKGSEDILAKVCVGISAYLSRSPVHAFLCQNPVRAHRVQGDPWLEDLNKRYPSSSIKVSFEPRTAVRQELLYAKLRSYGQLEDIQFHSESNTYTVWFYYTASAVAARNCLHRSRIETKTASGETESVAMLLEYEEFIKKMVWSTIVSNARYSIPLIALAMFATTYFIFDPLRVINIQIQLTIASLRDLSSGTALVDNGEGKVEVQPRQRVLPYGLMGRCLRGIARGKIAESWIREISGLSKPKRRNSLISSFWREREDVLAHFRRWINASHHRVMLLTGHRGNGHSTFAREAAGAGAIWLDVRPMLEGVEDNKFLSDFCGPLGYWPTPFLDRQASAFLDLMLPGTGKLKRDNEMIGAVQRVLASLNQALLGWNAMTCSDDGQGAMPLFVIDGFTAENKNIHAGLFDALVKWAAYVSEAQLARVLFIGDSSFAEPAVLQALGNRPERLTVEHLGDADMKTVRRILHSYLGEKSAKFTDMELATVGGRFRDLASLVTQLRDGADFQESVSQLLEANIMTVRTLLATGQPGAEWTRTQLWRAVRLLAEAPDESVPFDVFLWSVFRGDEVALRSMTRSLLIEADLNGASRGTSSFAVGGSQTVRAGSPLYGEVFRRLAREQGIAAVLDLEVASEDIRREQSKVEALQAELVSLQEVDDIRREKGRSLPDPNDALRKRKLQILGLISEQQAKLERFHQSRLDAMAVMKRRSDMFHASGQKQQQGTKT